MTKKILIYLLIDEYHAYMKFNVFLWILKKYNENIEITVFTQQNGIDVITETDKFIIIDDKLYYELIKKLPESRQERACLIADFNIDTVIPKHIKLYFDEILCYTLFEFKTLDNKYTEYKFNEEWFNTLNLGDCYFKRDIRLLQKWLYDGNIIKPTLQIFNLIKNKYQHLFNEKTYIIITRDYKNKQPEDNTLVVMPNLPNIINFLTNNNIKIINIGFPTAHMEINNSNYFEFNDKFTQNELICLFYLSNGVLLNGLNGGFIVHISSNIDIFLIYEEWCNMQLLNNRINNNKVNSIDICTLFKNNEKEKILDILYNYTKKSEQLFREENNIIILK